MKKALLILGLLLSHNAFATYTCSGVVEGVAIAPKTGFVYARSIGSLVFPKLCNVQTETDGISVDACKQIYSMLLSAQMAKKDVTFWFNDDANGGSCDAQQAWQPLSGWYFGPSINE